MKKFLLATVFFATFALLAACGDDVTEVTEVHQDGMAVLDAGLELSKQKCDTTNVGDMLFVTDSSEVFVCNGKTWQTLKGANGKDGADGKDGEIGPQGPQGGTGEPGEPGTDGDDGNDGESCTAKSVTNAAGLEGLEVTCGKTVIDTIWNGKDGVNGKPGEPGEPGTDGNDGSSCTAKSVKNSAGLKGIEVTCDTTVIDTIWSGKDGENGLDFICKAIRSTRDRFVPLEDVLFCIRPDEKVVFIIRHAERDKDASGTTGDLNSKGESQATYLGQKLAINKYDFNYMSTNAYRTMRTNVLISQGKGENFLTWDNVFDSTAINYSYSNDFTEKWFEIPGSEANCAGIQSWAQYTLFAYVPDTCTERFYDVDTKVNEIIDKHFKYDSIGRATIVISHDQFVAPFLISVTDRKIGLDAYKYVTFDTLNVKDSSYVEDVLYVKDTIKVVQNNWNQNVFKHWPNYLAGAAIIINEKNQRTFIPVKGLKTGYLGYHCPYDSDEDDLYNCSKWEKDVP